MCLWCVFSEIVFFKQKTAYEMRISDCSSDVCSSDLLAASEIASFFYCCEIFDPKEVKDWVDRNDTALCPKCGIDSVIGAASGFPVGNPKFLEQMREKWF